MKNSAKEIIHISDHVDICLKKKLLFPKQKWVIKSYALYPEFEKKIIWHLINASTITFMSFLRGKIFIATHKNKKRA